MWNAVSTLALAAVVAACGGGPDPLDPPSASGIEGVPVPNGAQLRSDVSGPIDAAYTVPGTTYSALVAWYQRNMPDGSAFGGWEWCDVSAHDTLHGKIYHQPGTNRILGVTISSGDPPGILIGHDDSGPC